MFQKSKFYFLRNLGKLGDTFYFRKRAYFVDLFVRVSNKVAINMYTNLGYIVYRTVLEYYSGDPDEDAYGMLLISYRSVLRYICSCF